MWKCHKCGKPVYFAERKQSLGYNWHPECLRCEECGKRLNPGQHAEHKGVPYCHVPCYGALFGPQLFGHGTRVESHKSFGQPQRESSPKTGLGNGGTTAFPRSQIETKLKVYNQVHEGKRGEIRSREVNGRIILEGTLRIHWGVQGMIHLKENDDQRTVVTVRKRNSVRYSLNQDDDSDYYPNNDCADNDDPTTVTSNIMTSSTCSSLPDDEFLDRSDCTNSNSTLANHSSELNDSSDQRATSSLSSVSSLLLDSNMNSDNCSDLQPLMPKSITLPSKLDKQMLEWDELDELLQVERRVDDSEKIYQTMPVPLPSSQSSSTDTSSSTKTPSNSNEISTNTTSNTLKVAADEKSEASTPSNASDSSVDSSSKLTTENSQYLTASTTCNNDDENTENNDDEQRRQRPKSGSTAIRRRPGKRLSRTKVRRRCSINGHFYDRETSFFTPPHGSQMSVWVTSLVNTYEVINLILEKYKVESDPNNFALFIVRDNGEQKRLKDDEYPLLVRVMLGPHEDVAKLFLMDSHNTHEVSSEMAQFINLSLAECRAILDQYFSQEEREVARIKFKYEELKRRMVERVKLLENGAS